MRLCITSFWTAIHIKLKGRKCALQARGKTDFEQLLEHFFHAFDQDTDGALSKKDFFEVGAMVRVLCVGVKLCFLELVQHMH